MSAFQLYRTSWFSQNLSSRVLNVFKVDDTMLSSKLFHNGVTLLEKLNLCLISLLANKQSNADENITSLIGGGKITEHVFT